MPSHWPGLALLVLLILLAYCAVSITDSPRVPEQPCEFQDMPGCP